MKNNIVNSTIINFINLAIYFMVSLVMTPIILNRVGTVQYGLWVFLGIFSITGYFSMLDLGMQGTAIKYIAEYSAHKDKEGLNQVINSVFFFFMIVGVIAGLVIFIFNYFFLRHLFNISPEYLRVVTFLVNLIAISFLYKFPTMGFAAVIEGMKRYDLLRIVSISITILTNIIYVLFLTFESGIWFLMVVMLVGSFVLMLAYFLISLRLLPSGIIINPFSFKTRIFRKMFSMSSKLFLSRLVGLAFNNTDKILIGIFLTMTLMTDYDIINKIHLIVLTIMSLMNQAIIPFTSSLNAQNNQVAIQKLFLKGTKYAILVTFPALIFFMIMSREFLSLWVGPDYARLSFLSCFYVSHVFFTVLTGVGSTMLVGLNRVGDILRISVSMAFLNLFISLIMINYFGIGGLVAGTVISYFAGFFFFVRFFTKIFNIKLSAFLSAVAKPYIVAILLIIIVFFVKSLIVFDRIIGLFFFGFFLYILYYAMYFIFDPVEAKELIENIPFIRDWRVVR